MIQFTSMKIQVNAKIAPTCVRMGIWEARLLIDLLKLPNCNAKILYYFAFGEDVTYWKDLEGTRQVSGDNHHGRRIVKLPTVVGRTKQCH